MKKLLLFICLCLCICLVNEKIIADVVVEYDETDPKISYDPLTNTLTLDDYVYDSSNPYFAISDYAIYADDDLTINLIGTNIIDGNEGIDVEGNLTITGDGSLDVSFLYVGANNFTVESGTVRFLSGTYSYDGPMVAYPAHVHYGLDKLMATYDELSYTYLDYLGTNDIEEFIIEARAPLANMNNIYDEPDTVYLENAYGESYELENVDGFIIYEPDKGTTVEYNPDTKIYNVEFFDDFSTDDYKLHYFELAIKPAEWGKIIEYEILDATNVYEIKPDSSFVPFEVGQIYYEPDQYVGGSVRYSLSSGGPKEVGTGYFTFACKKDNYISVKAKGADDSYQIINLKVKDNSSPTITPEEPAPFEGYVVPNTSVTKKDR